jgi:hypothetical protein
VAASPSLPSALGNEKRDACGGGKSGDVDAASGGVLAGGTLRCRAGAAVGGDNGVQDGKGKAYTGHWDADGPLWEVDLANPKQPRSVPPKSFPWHSCGIALDGGV